jgi:hypothetical protein
MHFQVVDFLCNCAFCDTLATTGNFIHRDDYHLWTLPRIEHSIMLRPDEESPVWQTGGLQMVFPLHLTRKREQIGRQGNHRWRA